MSDNDLRKSEDMLRPGSPVRIVLISLSFLFLLVAVYLAFPCLSAFWRVSMFYLSVSSGVVDASGEIGAGTAGSRLEGRIFYACADLTASSGVCDPLTGVAGRYAALFRKVRFYDLVRGEDGDCRLVERLTCPVFGDSAGGDGVSMRDGGFSVGYGKNFGLAGSKGSDASGKPGAAGSGICSESFMPGDLRAGKYPVSKDLGPFISVFPLDSVSLSPYYRKSLVALTGIPESRIVVVKGGGDICLLGKGDGGDGSSSPAGGGARLSYFSMPLGKASFVGVFRNGEITPCLGNVDGEELFVRPAAGSVPVGSLIERSKKADMDRIFSPGSPAFDRGKRALAALVAPCVTGFLYLLILLFSRRKGRMDVSSGLNPSSRA